MQNIEAWTPTKFIMTKRGLRGSRDARELSVRSRMVVDRIAAVYERQIRAHAFGSLLDLGCGKAPLYGLYSALVTEVTCVDWSESPHGTSHVDIAVDLNKGIPLPADRFDTVLATDVLEHLAKPERFWCDVQRVLRPAGVLILGVPFLYWIHESPNDHHRYTEHNLRGACADVGLVVECLESYGGPLTVVLDIVGKSLPGRLGPRVYEWVAAAILRSSAGQRVDARRRHQFPLGYCLIARKPSGKPLYVTGQSQAANAPCES